MNALNISGTCFVPLVTPLTEAFSVCRDSVARLIGQLDVAVAGLMPCLSTGEGQWLGEAQWRDMLHCCVQQRGARYVVVGVLRPTTEEVVERSRLAQRQGADGVIITTPYNGQAGQRQIFEHFKAVHDALDIPIFVYHESSLSPNRANPDTLFHVAALPRVEGIKDSSLAGDAVAEARRFRQRRVAVFEGRDEYLAASDVRLGNVAALANLDSRLCRRAAQGGRSKSLQNEIRARVNRFHLLGSEWYRAVKVVLKRRGVIHTDLCIGDTKVATHESA